MSVELTSKSIGITETYFDNFVEQGIDCDITLPDYCPDIMRILKCTFQNSVSNFKIIGDRATADGNTKIRVVYADEKNNIFCYEQDYPFSKYAELSTTYDNAVLCCTAKTEYVNCRAVSKRRADIHGVVSLHFKVDGSKETSVISDACGEGVQLKRKGLDIDDVVAVAVKNFEVSQVENVGDSNSGIGKVLDVCASAILNESKIIKGKILLKGELAVRVVYCADSVENETCMLNCNIPFNEIVEAAAVTDDCHLDVKLFVCRALAEPKTDNDGEYRYMNINADVSAQVTAFTTQQIKIITDAYSTDTELDVKYTPMDFLSVSQSFSDSLVCKQSLDISSLKPKKIYSFMTCEPNCKSRFDGDKMIIWGKLPVSIIIIDEDGTPVLCEREAEFEYTHSAESADNLLCSPQIEVSGCSCTLTGDGRADFKAEICISAVVFNNTRQKVITSLEAKEGTSKKKKPALVIYFCSGGESVWDIARKYNTTVEEIMQENELSADYLENKRMLMIPVK